MLTPEQIENLKPGDIIYLNNYPITFCDTNYNKSTISARDDASNCGEGDRCWFTLEYLTMQPQPKYDPCRPFKKGDRAQVVERNGRNVTCFPVGRIKVGDIVTVAENETGDVFIKVLTEDGHEMMAPWFMLELVTPVEELEPFSVEDCSGGGLHCYAVKHGVKHVSYHLYQGGTANHFYTREQAKAAAEADRDRLNAEFRKEQKHV